jgi:hypothetical protein
MQYKRNFLVIEAIKIVEFHNLGLARAKLLQAVSSNSLKARISIA